jgi:hypothetical protein
MELYKDPIITKYFDLIRLNTSIFQEFYYGDPIRVPASNLPALIMSRAQTRLSSLNNVQDEQSIELILSVVTDVREDLSDYTNIVAGVNSLYNIIEGREASTLQLKEDSLLNILRHNLLVDATNGLRTDLGSITTVDYGMTIGKRTEEGWAMEAQIKFVAHFTQDR